MKQTATEIKIFRGLSGDARLYELSTPMENYRGKNFFFVIVSALKAYSGPETYIFGSSKTGKIKNWMELPGSYKGGLCHKKALMNAGYTIKK